MFRVKDQNPRTQGLHAVSSSKSQRELGLGHKRLELRPRTHKAGGGIS